MRILKRILLAIMVMCLCASAGISLAFAEGESSAEGYTGTRYTVTGGAAGGQPLWFGNATPVNYAEAGTEVNIEYTVKTNAMSGSPDDGSASAGLCRIFKELGKESAGSNYYISSRSMDPVQNGQLFRNCQNCDFCNNTFSDWRMYCIRYE